MGSLAPDLQMSKRYHRARLPQSLKTLGDFLEHYESNEHDEGLEDPITWMNQGEYFDEAKGTDLTKLTCIKDVMTSVPVICRTITLHKPMFPGMNMNPWLGSVKTLPTIVRYMSTANFLKFANKEHDKELINCAMIVTKNPNGSILSHGIGKHISSFLLSGDSNLYHPDADLATWAMVVLHIYTQPSQATWMTEELEQIDFMNTAVYSDPESSWRKYLDLVESKDFRLGLVTQNASLPPWCKCPHINKFLLATFLLRDRLDTKQLEERRDAAVQEFFGRCFTMDQVPYFFEGKFESTVDQILNSFHLTMRKTLRETIREFTSKVERFNFTSIKFTVKEPTQETVRHCNMNLSCAQIVHFFMAMRPEVGELDDKTWRRLFVNGMCVNDSYKRNTGPDFVLTKQKLDNYIRTKMKREVLVKVPKHVLKQYQSITLVSHFDLPVLVSKVNAERFRQKYNRDLRDELDVNEIGLSRVACMCPKCPFFMKPLGPKTGTMAPELMEHLNSGVDGLYYTMQGPVTNLSDFLKIYVHPRINNINNLVNRELTWEEFEKHFI